MLSNDSRKKAELAITRVRQTPKLRSVTVTRVSPLTPHLVSISLAGDDLRDFESASFDDHVKVLFPLEGQTKPIFPTLGRDGTPHPGTARMVARDFTPRRFDPAAGELDIEFALHDAGPATQWAAQAQVGQHLGVGGPRGSMIIPMDFDWHLLIGDDTALPAIARRLEELPSTTRAIVVAEVAGPSCQIAISSKTDVEIIWCYREVSAPSALLNTLLNLPSLPPGEGYAWAAAESSIVRAVRQHLLNDRKLNKGRIRAAAYWKRGTQAVHEVIED
jgi:NADPH-dependent ferric siderophore reductase